MDQEHLQLVKQACTKHERISLSYELAQPVLRPYVAQKQSTIMDDQLSIRILLATNLATKIKETSNKNNPFLPPFEQGLFIMDIGSSHRLIYNKYNLYKEHYLLLTRQFQHQCSHLNTTDLSAIVQVSLTVRGCYFFNCGKQAGFSQEHKHIQFLGKQSLGLPIISSILSDIKHNELQPIQNGLYEYRSYNFLHTVEIIKSPLKDKSQLTQIYNRMMNQISEKIGKTGEEFSYNLIGCQYFLMIIPRKNQQFIREGMKSSINSLGFLGILLVSNQQHFQIFLQQPPSPILQQLTFSKTK